jgi:hypothetical protein
LGVYGVAYRDKKVVSVFVRFRAPLHKGKFQYRYPLVTLFQQQPFLEPANFPPKFIVPLPPDG